MMEEHIGDNECGSNQSMRSKLYQYINLVCRLTLGSGNVNNVAISFENINFLHALDLGQAHLLEDTTELLIVFRKRLKNEKKSNYLDEKR
jgi:hypothetical protein